MRGRTVRKKRAEDKMGAASAGRLSARELRTKKSHEDVEYRAVVPGYSSPAWVPVLLSGGAITGHVTAILAGIGPDGLFRRTRRR